MKIRQKNVKCICANGFLYSLQTKRKDNDASTDVDKASLFIKPETILIQNKK